MKPNTMKKQRVARIASLLVLSLTTVTLAIAFTPSQQPPESTAVPGNVLLALSVEFPTGLQVSYTQTYAYATKYDGYFDNRKCYGYNTSNEVFQPVAKQDTDGRCSTTGTSSTGTSYSAASQWSGNLLNWLTMTNIDQFRSVMTGGTRDSFSAVAIQGASYHGDTTDRTILIRSFSDRNSYNPEKSITGLRGMPLSNTKIVRSGGYGSKFIVSGSSNFSDLSTANQRVSCNATTKPSGGACYNIRVEACVSVPIGQTIPDVGLEANCKSIYSKVVSGVTYPVIKPEGLIQGYANALRFGAFGYLNETGQSRNGGVLRSAMKSVGTQAATATGVTANTAKEWSEVTGIMIDNPDTADATASGVSNSGLMNYLNKFGYAAGYKGNDPVGELYYASQLYMRGKTPPTNYSDNLTDALKDGFPVITGSNLLAGGTRDPIINTCQKNFILGIGDINTHCDGNLPGSTKGLNSTCGTTKPTDPDGLNVQSLWDTTRALEGLSDTGWVGGATYGTPYMAGLAHWANTNDIRSDLTGKQTISTYWVDVLENNANNVAAASLWKTQFWLAAKYGGFDTDLVTGNDPNTIRASWDEANRGIPDTWFAGSDPTSMKTGLTSAFANIAVRSGVNSASSAAVTSNRQTSNSQILYAGYNPKGWIGNVRACAPAQTAAQCDATPTWEASQWFKTLTTTYTTPPAYITTPLVPATRKIFTSSLTGTTLTSMPFLYASLNVAQKAVLDATDTQGSARVAFLRGDRTNENVLFRKREDTLMGDIVNSGVTYLSGAGPAYFGNLQSQYLAFRTANKSRRPVVYVGANDGMLHAFSGINGKELFAYIPGAVFGNLPSLTALGFQHKFFVDSTPMVGDIQQNATTWKTILVGGLGAGGKGYYALNITDQNSFSTAWSDTTLAALPSTETSAQATAKEAALSTLPMWEFTSSQDDDLGYTFNEPALDPFSGAYSQIAKVADNAVNGGTWRAIVGNGYGSTAGKAVLFMLDANNGVDTTTGLAPTKLTADIGPNNGLSAPRPVDTDHDGLVDTIYAGDALGNMHKFQFSKLNTAGTDYVIAAAGIAGGGAWRYIGKVFASGQPISTAPSVAQACDGVGWNVAFGTGKLNENNDYADTATRGFYAVVDKNASSSLTIASADIANIPYTATTVSSYSVRNWTTPSPMGSRGWKMEFTGGERVLSNSTLPPDTGTVLFATTKPTGNVCTPGNTGFIMAVNLCSGKIGNLTVAGTLVGGLGINSTGVVKVSNTYTNSGNKQAVVCNQDGCKGTTAPSISPSMAPKGRYSWREIFTK
jgi:type IV pilus assembly protein PilY1